MKSPGQERKKDTGILACSRTVSNRSTLQAARLEKSPSQYIQRIPLRTWKALESCMLIEGSRTRAPLFVRAPRDAFCILRFPCPPSVVAPAFSPESTQPSRPDALGASFDAPTPLVRADGLLAGLWKPGAPRGACHRGNRVQEQPTLHGLKLPTPPHKHKHTHAHAHTPKTLIFQTEPCQKANYRRAEPSRGETRPRQEKLTNKQARRVFSLKKRIRCELLTSSGTPLAHCTRSLSTQDLLDKFVMALTPFAFGTSLTVDAGNAQGSAVPSPWFSSLALDRDLHFGVGEAS